MYLYMNVCCPLTRLLYKLIIPTYETRHLRRKQYLLQYCYGIVVGCVHCMHPTNREIQDMMGINPDPADDAAAATTARARDDTELISPTSALTVDSSFIESSGISVSSNRKLKDDGRRQSSELPTRHHSRSKHQTSRFAKKDSAGASNNNDSNNGKNDQRVFEQIAFPYNCLPWYYKQRLVFEINAVRRRLQYLVVEEKSVRFDSIVKPSLIQSTPYHGSFMSKNCTSTTATGRMLPGNLPRKEQDPYFYKIFHRKSVTRCQTIAENPAGKSFVVRGRSSSSLLHLLSFSTSKRLTTGGTPTILPSNSLGTQILSSSSSSSSQNLKHIHLTNGSNSRADDNDYKQRNRSSLTKPQSSLSEKKKIMANNDRHEWFVRTNAPQQPNTHPTYCSMEIIQFNAETGTFCREEIAYPYQPVVTDDNRYGGVPSSSKSSRRLSLFSSFPSIGKWKQRDTAATDKTDATSMVRKRMAKRLIVHTISAKNIEKRTMIYQ